MRAPRSSGSPRRSFASRPTLRRRGAGPRFHGWAVGIAVGATLLGGWAGEWPQFLGPTRNGVYAAHDVAAAWPKEGPPVLWQRSVGQGFSGPVVTGSRLVLFHRVGDQAVIECCDAGTGRPQWTFGYPTDYHDQIVGEDHGPRATPVLGGGKVYTLGAEGMLHCLDLTTGKKLWRHDARTEFGAKEGFFGFACSPVLDGGLVLVNLGGPHGAGIVAFDAASGQVRWSATDDEASYSSPVVVPVGGQRLALFFTRAGLVGLDPARGVVRFRFPWRSRQYASVNAATPVVVGDRIFLSASYETGAVLLRVADHRLEKVWSGDDLLSNHYATSVYHDGYLFGFDGRQEYGPRLRCVAFPTGAVRWTKEGLGAGNLLLAGDQLLVLLEKGLLLAVAATPEGYRELASAQILGGGVRAQAALADGRLYARDHNRLVCLDLKRP